MALDAHISELAARHLKLEEQIEQEIRYPGSDDLQISELKREKLRLKEEIERLSADRAA